MKKGPVSLEERVRVAVWLLAQTEGREVGDVDALVRAAVCMLVGDA